ncbi:unnamed protein product [Caenorhabditis nigoni]
MEKVRLVFIFSRPVSPGFLKILKDAKCVVKLNDHRKMTYFSSPDAKRILRKLQKRQWDFWQFSTSRRRSKADTAGYLREESDVQ